MQRSPMRTMGSISKTVESCGGAASTHGIQQSSGELSMKRAAPETPYTRGTKVRMAIHVSCRVAWALHFKFPTSRRTL